MRERQKKKNKRKKNNSDFTSVKNETYWLIPITGGFFFFLSFFSILSELFQKEILLQFKRYMTYDEFEAS